MVMNEIGLNLSRIELLPGVLTVVLLYLYFVYYTHIHTLNVWTDIQNLEVDDKKIRLTSS